MVYPGIPVSVKVGVGGTVPPVLCDDAGQSNGMVIMAQPEQQTREAINKMLAAAGWHITDLRDTNLTRAQALRQTILARAFQHDSVPQASIFQREM